MSGRVGNAGTAHRRGAFQPARRSPRICRTRGRALRSGPPRARMTAVDVSVVIPTLRRELLRRCLEALAAAGVLAARVFVVDQGRVNALERMAEEFHAAGLDVAYLPSMRTGRSAGLNDGIRQVTTEFLAITDDDCVPAADWVAKAAALLRREPGTIVSGRV